MKDSSLGSFLQQLRKENQLTQKELASQLHVTDKAVSKWERDLSAPDISLLIPLAQILGVSTTELLQGRRMADPPQAETESSVAEALRYSDRQVRHRLRRLWAPRPASLPPWVCWQPASACCVISVFLDVSPGP
ncbi:MAG: helix-turn-helix domain-containing protein [Evtepia gabavorous]